MTKWMGVTWNSCMAGTSERPSVTVGNEGTPPIPHWPLRHSRAENRQRTTAIYAAAFINEGRSLRSVPSQPALRGLTERHTAARRQ
jgi:hypothetical protein